MRTATTLLTLVAIFALFGAPAIFACGGMTILPPPPASDPDVPDLPADGDLGTHCRATTGSGVCGAPVVDGSDFCAGHQDSGADSVFTEAIL